MLTADQAARFADEWIAAWNAHDLDRVLAHYTDDFEMASPKIADIAGEPSGVLRGKGPIRAYWAKAMQLVPGLHFDEAAVFVGPRSLAIHDRNQLGRFVVEVFELAADGRCSRASAHYA